MRKISKRLRSRTAISHEDATCFGASATRQSEVDCNHTVIFHQSAEKIVSVRWREVQSYNSNFCFALIPRAVNRYDWETLLLCNRTQNTTSCTSFNENKSIVNVMQLRFSKDITMLRGCPTFGRVIDTFVDLILHDLVTRFQLNRRRLNEISDVMTSCFEALSSDGFGVSSWNLNLWACFRSSLLKYQQLKKTLSSLADVKRFRPSVVTQTLCNIEGAHDRTSAASLATWVLAHPPIFKRSVGTLWNVSPLVPFPAPLAPSFGFLMGDSASSVLLGFEGTCASLGWSKWRTSGELNTLEKASSQGRPVGFALIPALVSQ